MEEKEVVVWVKNYDDKYFVFKRCKNVIIKPNGYLWIEYTYNATNKFAYIPMDNVIVIDSESFIENE